MSGGIWGDKPMTALDAFTVSLSGMATVFVVLISLALAIIIMGKILNSIGVTKTQETKVAASTSQKTASVPVAAKPVEEDMQEYAVILAAVSEHTRTPIERLKITSITKR